MFIDEAKIIVGSGKGGNGMVHFHREKYVTRGGPDGGDGGRGGDVVLEVRPTLNTLSAFRFTTKFMADEGKNGGINDMTGRSAENLIIHVPPGTMVRDDASGELLGDLVEPGQQLVVCKGGRGGRGNPHFATSRHAGPAYGREGRTGRGENLAPGA